MFQNVPDFIYTHVLLILQCIKSNNIDNNHKCSLRNCNIQLKRTKIKKIVVLPFHLMMSPFSRVIIGVFTLM